MKCTFRINTFDFSHNTLFFFFNFTFSIDLSDKYFKQLNLVNNATQLLLVLFHILIDLNEYFFFLFQNAYASQFCRSKQRKKTLHFFFSFALLGSIVHLCFFFLLFCSFRCSLLCFGYQQTIYSIFFFWSCLSGDILGLTI